MNDPIQAHLDGELPFEALAKEDRLEVRRYRRVLDRTLDALTREPVPDVSAAVMESLERLEAAPAGRRKGDAGPRWTRWLTWLWSPRTVSLRLRPAWVLAAAVLAVFLLRPEGGSDGSSGAWIQPGGTVVATSAADGRVLVRFRLDAPGASSVSLAGDFTGWQASEHLSQVSPGLWAVVVAVEPGIHEYAFVIDGRRWVPDPRGERVEDGFGGANSRVAVLPPDGLEGA